MQIQQPAAAMRDYEASTLCLGAGIFQSEVCNRAAESFIEQRLSSQS